MPRFCRDDKTFREANQVKSKGEFNGAFMSEWFNFALNCLDLLLDLFVKKLAARIFNIHFKPN